MSDTSAQPIVVFMTAGDRDEADRIAEALVDARLAACVQILPEIKSVYRWKGAIERANEVLLLAKTTTEKFAELDRVVREIHSYDTPEIVAVPADAVSKPYLKWLLEGCS